MIRQQALRVAARLTASGRDPGQIIRDLEIHGRELLAVQMLDELPEELRVTPERDQRLLAQANAIAASTSSDCSSWSPPRSRRPPTAPSPGSSSSWC